MKNLKIKKWLRSGEFDPESLATIQNILDDAGRMLDKAYSHDITGDCVFQGEDGKWYVGSVEFVVNRADPAYIKDLLTEDEEQPWNNQPVK